MSCSLQALKKSWRGSSLGHESTFHQLAPYIGKLKTTIAGSLIERYSTQGQTILDPFSGSGVVPLEAILLKRNIIANDLNPYAATLTRAKMFGPASSAEACANAEHYIHKAKKIAAFKNYATDAPLWVKRFFHRRTLSETECLAGILKNNSEWFLLACLLGILHHQRPGFLSYPSSHLVPYLRLRRFPKKEYPEMYQYRDVSPRLTAKIMRAYRRNPPVFNARPCIFTEEHISALSPQYNVDLVLTSPPYMNALDYGRDNRLRLWLLGYSNYHDFDGLNCKTPDKFAALICQLVKLVDSCLTRRGTAVVVVGEIARRSLRIDTARIVESVFCNAGKFQLVDKVTDLVPDVRRSRRGSKTTKREWILTFSRTAKQ